uniref:Ig-like domain-containing protein n=1 Tax=Arion vulgaris TaxID=1028688 RepID=A0A0B7A7R1_9EUPU
MFKSSVLCLAVLSIVLCGVSFGQVQNELSLDRNCYVPYDGYVISPSSCTCIKTNRQAAGNVQWYFSNGTLAKQNSTSDNGTSILTVESPHKYAVNQSFICRIVLATGQKGAELNYTAKFIFGPESAVLKWEHTPTGPIYRCPSNETNELRLVCQFPSNLVNPSPVFTVVINGQRYGAYDKLSGQINETDKTWNLNINFKLNRVGNSTVSCYVRNLYANYNWSTLTQIITVADNPPASFKC